MERRIFICGPSSAGKTTLAKWISDEFHLGYMYTNGEALRKKFDYNSHIEIMRDSLNNPETGFKYQVDLLNERKRLINENNNFVTDRSPIDNIVYFLLQCSPVVHEDICKQFIDDCITLLSRATHIIVLRSANQVEDDGVRVMNTFYQGLTDGVVYHVLNEIVKISNYNVLLYPTWNMADRQDEVRKFLNE